MIRKVVTLGFGGELKTCSTKHVQPGGKLTFFANAVFLVSGGHECGQLAESDNSLYASAASDAIRPQTVLGALGR